MKETVVIKGTKSGLILALDSSIPYEQLKKMLQRSFVHPMSFGRSIEGNKFSGKNT